MKIMEIMLETMRCSAGYLLTNDCVCSMLEETFHMRNRRGANRLLAQYAENVIMQMIMVLFARAADFPAVTDCDTGGLIVVTSFNSRVRSRSASTHTPSPSVLSSASSHAHLPVSGDAPACASLSPPLHTSGHAPLLRPERRQQASGESRGGSVDLDLTESDQETLLATVDTGFSLPYDVHALHRVFRFVTGLCNPGDVKNDVPTRCVSVCTCGRNMCTFV